MEATSLRERKKEATRVHLMNVALRLFEGQGFDETTVEAIAAAADVAPRTFFRYFPTKVDVLFADHPEEIALFRDTLARRRSGESVIDALRRAMLDAIEKAVAEPARFLTRSRLVASVPAANSHSRYLDSQFEDVIAEAAAADRGTDPATDLRARVVARVGWGAACAARDIWVTSEGRREPHTVVNEAFDMLADALAPSPSPGRRKARHVPRRLK